MSFGIIYDADEKLPFGQEIAVSENLVSQDLNFDLTFGKITGKQWTFDGIRIAYLETNHKVCGEIKWKSEGEMVMMHFNLKGSFSVSELGSRQQFDLGNNQHNVFYGKNVEGIIEVKELESKIFLVQFSKKKFFGLINQENQALKRFAENITINDCDFFSDKGLEIDFLIHQCILSVLNCPFDDSVKRMYFSSKVVELLVLQAESFAKAQNKIQSISEYDKERILYAKDFLVKNVDCPPNLQELARISGINDFKLKKGFKEIFGTTVYQYLSETRLEMAKTALLKKENTVGEIAYNLGYSSVQHFSNSFKKKFGMPPSEVE